MSLEDIVLSEISKKDKFCIHFHVKTQKPDLIEDEGRIVVPGVGKMEDGSWVPKYSFWRNKF
jgi:hypothetical protein